MHPNLTYRIEIQEIASSEFRPIVHRCQDVETRAHLVEQRLGEFSAQKLHLQLFFPEFIQNILTDFPKAVIKTHAWW